MHDDEVHTDESGLVRRLLAAQLPDWASLPLERVPSSGTRQRSLQARRRQGRSPTSHRLGHRRTGAGARVAPQAGPTPAGRDPRTARNRVAWRGLSVALGRLSMAPGREPPGRTDRGCGFACNRPRRIPPGASPDHLGRSAKRSRRPACAARCSNTGRARRSARRDRRRRCDLCLGRVPASAGVVKPAGLASRRPATRKPTAPRRSPYERHRLRRRGSGRSGMRPDRCVGGAPAGGERALPRRAGRRRRHMDARPRLGTIHRAHRAAGTTRTRIPTSPTLRGTSFGRFSAARTGRPCAAARKACVRSSVGGPGRPRAPPATPRGSVRRSRSAE